MPSLISLLPRVDLPRCRLLPLFALLVLAVPASAATLTVPTQYTTIPAAINAAVSGDTVLISDGTYTGPGNVDLDFGGRNITVTSQNGPTKTIIDCGGSASASHRGFYLNSGETSAIISGLTIENGYAYQNFGGAVVIRSSSSTIGVAISVTNCTITNSTASNSGGIGLYNNGPGTINVTNCTITNNTASVSGGGGIYNTNNGSGTINVTNNGSGTINVTNCMIVGNTASSGGGIYNTNGGLGTINVTNCTITGNTTRGSSATGIYNSVGPARGGHGNSYKRHCLW